MISAFMGWRLGVCPVLFDIVDLSSPTLVGDRARCRAWSVYLDRVGTAPSRALRFNSCRGHQPATSPGLGAKRATSLHSRKDVMKITNIDEALLAVDDYHGAYKAALSSEEAEKGALKANGHERNYVLLADASRICAALLANPKVMAQLLTNFDIAAAGENQNPFGPLVRALFRKEKKGGGTQFNKSCWKFGNVLRFIRDEGWKPEEVAEKLRSLERPVNGKIKKKLLCAELLDRAKYANEDHDARRANDLAIQFMLEGEGIGVVEGASIEVEDKVDGRLVTLAASWSAKRAKWIIRAVAVTNSDAVAKTIMPKAVEAYKAGEIDLLKRVARQHVDVEAANFSAGEKQMFADMQIGDFVWPVPVPNRVKVKSKRVANDKANGVEA